MRSCLWAQALVGLLVLTASLQAQQPAATARSKKIVLVAGETAKIDVMGHHDYLAGCQCLDVLLRQTPGVTCVSVREGWPEDDAVFNDASSIVFYTDGGGKQAFMNSPARIARVQALVDSGVGLVMIHQAVDFLDEHGDQALSWLGGVYLKNVSGRGHWDSKHVDFPQHPITSGVTAWSINDGWLNKLKFVPGMKGVTPLVWSGKEYAGSRAGLDGDVVAWAYERPGGGRSFGFTGLDAHGAWKLAGMRQLVVNGVLWSAGVELPAAGAPCKIDDAELDRMQTPREPKPKAKAAKKAE